HISWLVPFVAALIGIGGMGAVSTWLIGPIRGVLVAAKSGNLPPLFQRMNKNGMPITLLIAQASLISLNAVLLLFVPSINTYFWMMVDLATMIYLIMYVLIFLAAIRLRYTRPDVLGVTGL
ncbi:MAG: amino acid permease, partial [Planctomycetes bacterium]|nr:amino acid permease [Planctomycetota bacterium]